MSKNLRVQKIKYIQGEAREGSGVGCRWRTRVWLFSSPLVFAFTARTHPLSDSVFFIKISRKEGEEKKSKIKRKLERRRKKSCARSTNIINNYTLAYTRGSFESFFLLLFSITPSRCPSSHTERARFLYVKPHDHSHPPIPRSYEFPWALICMMTTSFFLLFLFFILSEERTGGESGHSLLSEKFEEPSGNENKQKKNKKFSNI